MAPSLAKKSFTHASFVVSNTDYKKCPKADKPEYAFIGRSNVGKSSLINMLADNKKLAKTSGRPGKTQLINHFLIDDTWYLVDLPGYGWAKVSKAQRQDFQKMIHSYLRFRSNLYGVFVLLDVRLSPQKIDTEFLDWLGQESIPFAIIFTKADKLSAPKLQQAVAIYKKALSQLWDPLPHYFISSAEDHRGSGEIIQFIRETIKQGNES
ncbi:MAG: ribosome biogenesis GTP-binding protein YihA/YsxC [Cyclobacteriaceae bacterium]